MYRSDESIVDLIREMDVDPRYEVDMDQNSTENSLHCSCENITCAYNGTKCYNSDKGTIRLPCYSETPTYELCSKCCMFEVALGFCVTKDYLEDDEI